MQWGVIHSTIQHPQKGRRASMMPGNNKDQQGPYHEGMKGVWSRRLGRIVIRMLIRNSRVIIFGNSYMRT